MKRLPRFLVTTVVSAIVSAVIFATPAGLIAQELPKVGIIPISFPAESAAAERIAGSIADTLELLITMTGQYTVTMLEPETSVDANSPAATVAEMHQLDGIIYGSVAEPGGGGLRFSLSGYDRFLDETTTDVQLEVDSYLDSFDATDRIAVALIEGFSGVRLTYGSIRINGPEFVAGLAFFINGVPLNVTGQRIDGIVSGGHTFRVEQERLFGTEVLFEDRLTVEEGEATVLDLVIPDLTPRERESFTLLDQDIREYYLGKRAGEDLLDEIEPVLALIAEQARPTAMVERFAERYRTFAALAAAPGEENGATIAPVGAPPPGVAGTETTTEAVPPAGRVPNAGDIVAAIGTTGGRPIAVPARRLSARLTEYDVAGPWRVDRDEEGHLWGSNRNGIVEIIPGEERVLLRTVEDEFPLAHWDNGDVAVDGENLWISYAWEGDTTFRRQRGSGVTRWNRRTGEMTHYTDTTPNFPPGPVWSVARSPEGQIWVGSRYGAEAYFDGTRWNPFVIEDHNPNDAFFDCNTIFFNSGYIYFLTWRGGLHRYNPTTRQWDHSQYGKMWNGERKSFFARGLYGSNVVAAPDGSIYVGGSANREQTMNPADGIWHFDGEQWRNINGTVPVGDTSILGVALDGDGRLWASFQFDRSIRIYADGVWSRWNPEGLPEAPERRLEIVGIHDEHVVFSQTVGGRDTILTYRLGE